MNRLRKAALAASAAGLGPAVDSPPVLPAPSPRRVPEPEGMPEGSLAGKPTTRRHIVAATAKSQPSLLCGSSQPRPGRMVPAELSSVPVQRESSMPAASRYFLENREGPPSAAGVHFTSRALETANTAMRRNHPRMRWRGGAGAAAQSTRKLSCLVC